LDASDRARRQLLADVSHELKTPLTSIRGYVDTLLDPDVPLDATTRDRYLRVVSRESLRLERIVGDLLELARLEGGGLRMRRERVSVAELFAIVAERYEHEIATRGIRLTRTIAPGAEQIIGDPDRLGQAVLNLAANALRYLPDEGALTLAADCPFPAPDSAAE